MSQRLAAVMLVGLLGGSAMGQDTGVIRESIRARVERGGTPSRLAIGEDLVHAEIALPAFYEARFFEPAWVDAIGLTPAAEELLQVLGEADREGLDPDRYHRPGIESILDVLGEGREPSSSRLADLDLLLTDAYMTFGSHRLSGCVNPESFDPEWVANRREADFAVLLSDAIEKGAIRRSLDELLPSPPGYDRLREALALYRGIEGGWTPIGEGPIMRPGDTGDRVARLRGRLATTGDIDDPDAAGTTFDADLESAVRRFQARHGLAPDGIVGERTLGALDVPAAERVRQIEINLERWRWLPQSLGERHVLVNIPDYRLHLVEAGAPVLEMGVVVGTAYRRTPVFSDLMRYLVLNPSWEVPHKIAVEDKLPLIRKDPGYLANERFRVFDGRAPGGPEIDPATIDWSSLGRGRFPYRMRQDPGPRNALGRIKFMFPNKFNVYLHDTPARDLFSKEARPFSSGCIRLEHPVELATRLLRDDPAWTAATLNAALESGRERTVALREPVAVHILYWTAWADAEGTVHFRHDIYGRDRRLMEALEEPPPGVPASRS